jgi:hypothetical protein
MMLRPRWRSVENLQPVFFPLLELGIEREVDVLKTAHRIPRGLQVTKAVRRLTDAFRGRYYRRAAARRRPSSCRCRDPLKDFLERSDHHPPGELIRFSPSFGWQSQAGRGRQRHAIRVTKRACDHASETPEKSKANTTGALTNQE